ncbi:hypothetical protein [Stackebrandtia nassauensis]|uniref:hypothetical protein n=1 Tax=Stackebrandtia nassauensis TaxID=283811 RepID=UPI0001A3AA36|nr:hypothetical protein [Stackebrandtia nassauensis]
MSDKDSVAEAARRMCRAEHKPDRVQVRKACDACFEAAVRNDERVAVQLETAEASPWPEVDKAIVARSLRARGVRIVDIMAGLSASYETVWTWLHSWPVDTDGDKQFRRPATPMFVAVA